MVTVKLVSSPAFSVFCSSDVLYWIAGKSPSLSSLNITVPKVAFIVPSFRMVITKTIESPGFFRVTLKVAFVSVNSGVS